MALLRSAFRRLFERFAHFLRRRETPLRAQECAAQEQGSLEKLPEASVMKAGENEAFDFTAKNKKRRRRRRQYGEKKRERKVKKRETNEGGSHKNKAEKEKETLSLEEIKDREHGPQKEREPAAEPTPLLVEVKPLQALVSPPERSSFLKPLEGDLPLLPCVSEDLPPPAARFRPLPPVTKPPMCPQTPDPAPEEVTPQVSPPKLLAVPPRPTPASDELFSFRLSLPKQLVVAPSPTPASDEVVDLRCSSTEVCPPSPVEPLMLIDIEDEETEYVEYTGKTYQARDLLKTKSPRLREAEMKPRRMIAWLESDSEELEEVWTSEELEEVWTSEELEEVWTSEVLEVHGFEEEEDNPGEMGDSKAVEGHLEDASQEKEVSDGNMKELFCVGSPEGPENETQHNVVVQKEPKSKRKVAFFLFAWAEWKAKKKEEKKMRKEKERKDKELLLERYRNDPKLKHLLINKHNRHNCSSE